MKSLLRPQLTNPVILDGFSRYSAVGDVEKFVQMALGIPNAPVDNANIGIYPIISRNVHPTSQFAVIPSCFMIPLIFTLEHDVIKRLIFLERMVVKLGNK